MNPLLLATVLVVAPSAFGFPQPQAGNHAAAQQGQLTTRAFSPYANQQQQQNQQWPNWGQQQQSPQQKSDGQLCAGCLPSPQSQSSGYGYNSGSGMMMENNLPGSGFNNFQRSGPNGGGGNRFNNGPGFGYTYDVQLTQPQWGQQQQMRMEEQARQSQNDPATVQHLQINDDGQYSFSYNSADSSRQEQRNLDGTVTGNYAYTDPTGQQVQVDYRASPNEGYHAFGNNIPSLPQSPSVQQALPVPVQDTPEVQAARAQFFKAYDQQVQRIQQETAARAVLLEQQKSKVDAEGQKVVSIHSENDDNKKSESSDANILNTPSGLTKGSSSLDFTNLPDPIATPDKEKIQHPEIEEDDELDDNDAVVISGDDSDRPKAVPVRVPQSVVRQDQQGQGPQPSYQISQVIGADVKSQGSGPVQVVPQIMQRGEGGFNGQNQNQNQVQGQSGQNGQNQLGNGLPGYFYYVSVGGSPHYVTSSNLMRSDFPTSLKASLVGAMPLSAVHDAQVPQPQSGGQAQVKSTPPVYLDFDNSNKQTGFGYNFNNNNNQMNMNVQPQQQQQRPSQQGASYTFGFIPGTIVQFRNDGFQNQNQQGQSSNGIQSIGYPFFAFWK